MLQSKPAKKKQKYPPPKLVAVDVDGTLIINGIVNADLVKWIKQKSCEGFKLMLWSARGEDHARKAADMAGLSDVFDFIISKPGYIVDDRGWSWIKYTRVISDY